MDEGAHALAAATQKNFKGFVNTGDGRCIKAGEKKLVVVKLM